MTGGGAPAREPRREITRPTDREFLGAAAAFASLVAVYFVLHPGFTFDILGYRVTRLSPVLSNAPAGLRALWREFNAPSVLGAAVYLTIIVAMCSVQIVASRKARNAVGPAVVPLVAAGFVLGATAGIVGAPVHSTDLASYLAIAELSHEGLNPYVARPKDHLELQSRVYGARANHGSLYGPLATRLFSWLYFPTRGAAGFLLTWRMFTSALLAIALLLLWDSWKGLGRAPPDRRALLVMVAWSPLVLLEGTLHGHVDVVSFFLLALGVQRIARGDELLGLTCVACTVAVKLTMGVLLPGVIARAVFGAESLGHGLRRAALVLVGGAIFYAVWLLPDRLSWNHLDPLWQLRSRAASTLLFLVREAARPAGLAGFAGPLLGVTFALVLLRGLRSVRDRESFFRRMARDYLLYVLVFGPRFFPWYLLPAFVLASVTTRARTRHAVVLVATTSLALFTAIRLANVSGIGALALLWSVTLLPAAVLLLAPDGAAPRSRADPSVA